MGPTRAAAPTPSGGSGATPRLVRSRHLAPIALLALAVLSGGVRPGAAEPILPLPAEMPAKDRHRLEEIVKRAFASTQVTFEPYAVRPEIFEYLLDHPEFASHVTARVNPDAVDTDIRGEELRWWTEVRSAFPDMLFTVDLLIESGDLVVSNWTVRGTHTGTPFYGVGASGQPVEINGTAILRIREGKIVEHWGGPHCQDGVGLTH